MAEKCFKLYIGTLDKTYKIGTKASGYGKTVLIDKKCPVKECLYHCKYSIYVNEDGLVNAKPEKVEENQCAQGN